MTSPFNIEQAFLEQNVFVHTGSKRSRHPLSANFLPNLFYHLKEQMTETERSSLKDFEVQNLLIETQMEHERFSDLASVTEYLLSKLRSDISYWIKNTEPFLTIFSNLDPEDKKDIDITVAGPTKETEKSLKEYNEYITQVEDVNQLDEEEQKDDEYAEIDDFDVNPEILKYIKGNEGFRFKAYQQTVDNFYSTKKEPHFKKRSQRLQDKGKKREEYNMDPEEETYYLNKMRDYRDDDRSFVDSIFVINRTNKLFRIEGTLFPIIFQFILKKNELTTTPKLREQVHLYQRMQNVIYLCLCTDDKRLVYVNEKPPKGAYIETDDKESEIISEIPSNIQMNPIGKSHINPPTHIPGGENSNSFNNTFVFNPFDDDQSNTQGVNGIDDDEDDDDDLLFSEEISLSYSRPPKRPMKAGDLEYDDYGGQSVEQDLVKTSEHSPNNVEGNGKVAKSVTSQQTYKVPQSIQDNKSALDEECVSIAATESRDGPEWKYIKGNELLEEFVIFAREQLIEIPLLFKSFDDTVIRKYNLLENTLRICQIFLDDINRWELAPKPSLAIQDITFDKDKMRQLVYYLEESNDFTNEVLKSILDYYHVEFERKRIFSYISETNAYAYYNLRKLNGERECMQGIFNEKKHVSLAVDEYQIYLDAPKVVSSRKYIFHDKNREKFTKEQAQKFLDALSKLYNTPINNKKIAKHMGNEIVPNHIRFIKAKYQRALRKRAKKLKMNPHSLLEQDRDEGNVDEVIQFT